MKTLFRFSLVVVLLLCGHELLSANAKRKGKENITNTEVVAADAVCDGTVGDATGGEMTPGIGDGTGGGTVPMIEMALPFGIPFQYTDMTPSGGGPDNAGG
ncbi:MAG: hypothetical protein ACRC3B_06690, partial [Bacteroidia bacterium]